MKGKKLDKVELKRRKETYYDRFQNPFFSNILKAKRKANNLTQEKVGKMLGVHYSTISKVENGTLYNEEIFNFIYNLSIPAVA